MATEKKKLKVIVCTEGGTLNGYAITRDQIKQMAENYDTRLYAARINLEHVTSIYPDSPWRHFSLVDSVSAVELKDGPLKGKLALEVTAELDPVKDAAMISLNKEGRKIFSSIEFLPDSPNDAAKGAYLTGVALTDTPAAFGTQVIKLSNRERGLPEDAKNTYTASLETQVDLVAEAKGHHSEQKKLSERFMEGIQKTLGIYRETGSDENKALREAIELTANKYAELQFSLQGFSGQQATLTQQAEKLNALETELCELKQTLSRVDGSSESRSLSDGTGEIKSEY